MIQFLDTSVPPSPLPQGITVTITLASNGSAVGSGVTDSQGLVNVAVTEGTQYVAAFAGAHAPTTTQAFGGGTYGAALELEGGGYVLLQNGGRLLLDTQGQTIVTVAGYISPANTRITQAIAEAIQSPQQQRARISDVYAEVLQLLRTQRARVSQAVVEVITPHLPARARVSQAVVEVIRVRTYSLDIEPKNATITASQTLQYAAYRLGPGSLRTQVFDAMWTIAPLTGSTNPGTISATGLFTPSGAIGTFKVTATETSGSGSGSTGGGTA